MGDVITSGEKQGFWSSNYTNGSSLRIGDWKAAAVYMLVIGLLLSLLSNPAASDYDACRFLRNDGMASYLSTESGDALSTILMHYIYASDWHGLAFLRASCINLVGLIVSVYVFRAKQHPLYRSPLSIAFLALPGKEAWLIIAIIVWSSQCFQKKQCKDNLLGRFRIWMATIFSLIIITVIRLPYLVIFIACSVYVYIFFRKWYNLLYLALLLTFIMGSLVGGVLEHLIGLNLDFFSDASTAGAAALRNVSFGYTPLSMICRTMIYAAYLIFLPLIETFRCLSEVLRIGIMPYHFFLVSAVIVWFRYFKKGLKRQRALMVVSASILLGISFPIIHTRYLFIIILFLETAYNRIGFSQGTVKSKFNGSFLYDSSLLSNVKFSGSSLKSVAITSFHK